ncbi:MAG: phage tail sheath family protein, partial [Thermoplasmata archaeon]
QIEQVNRTFLTTLWARGMLYPSDDPTRAFFVKCDRETNPESEVRLGRVTCQIGINPPYPAEFVIFVVGLWDGGTSIEEEIARRG